LANARHTGLLVSLETDIKALATAGTLAGLAAASVMWRKVPSLIDFTKGTPATGQYQFPGILICPPPYGEKIVMEGTRDDDWQYPVLMAIAARDENDLTASADVYWRWREQLLELFSWKKYVATSPAVTYHTVVPDPGPVIDWSRWMDGNGIFASWWTLIFKTRITRT